MLRGVSEPFHNAPKIFRPFSKAFNSHLSNLSNRRPPPNITFPLLKERNGIDRRKSSFISRLLLFFRSKKPTNNHGSPTGTTKKISRKERERRRKGGGKELARNPRKQKHSGTTSFTSFFSVSYPLGRGTFRNIYPVVLHSIENLVSLFCNRLLRLVTSLPVHLLNSHDPRDR